MHAPLDIANFFALTQVVGIPESLYPWYSFGKHALLGLRFWILMLLLLKISKAPWKRVSSLLKQISYTLSLKLKRKQKHKKTTEKD